MSDPNLTGALRQSLKVVESEAKAEASPEGFSSENSPLREVLPNAIDELFDRINNNLAMGMPEAVSDEDLRQLADVYRAQMYKYAQEEQQKKDRPRASRKKKSDLSEAANIDLLDNM